MLPSPRFAPIFTATLTTVVWLAGSACSGRSQLRTVRVDAPSLAANTIGLGTGQTVRVYLPPGYDRSVRRYPVLYFLPGYDDPAWVFTGGSLQGFRLREALDELLAKGRIEEMIVVIPNGATSMGGTFYTNSPVLGNWENYIVGELVAEVDRQFRTRADSAARAVAGTTSGGSGAILLAMRHPDVFGAVYAMDPVLLHPASLDPGGLCSAEDAGRLLDLQKSTAILPAKQAAMELKLTMQGLVGGQTEAGSLRAFFVALGAAFSPDGASPGLPVRFPFRRAGSGIVVDSAARAAIEEGLGDWKHKIARYEADLRKLRLLALDYGTGNGIRWLPAGCDHVAALLAAAGIPHRTFPHPADHESRFRERMEEFLLPTVSRVLHAPRGSNER
jgi:hypothetical protein